jgi:NAD(P)H dehydrogenase (quinone)
MTRLMDEWCLHYPGVRHVEHIYFYGVNGASDETRRNYLDRAYSLGRNFTGTTKVAAA